MKNMLNCKGELVSINGHNIHVYRQGNPNKPKIVLMSGSSTVAPVFDFKILYEKLADDFRVIVIEKFGYGYSEIYETPCDIDTLVSVQKEALNKLGEEGPYILAPHSMSGLEAIRWKQNYPEDVRAIIGLDTAIPAVYQSWTEKELLKRIKFMEKARKYKLQKLPMICAGNKQCLSEDEVKQQKLLRKRNAFNSCYINEAKEVLKNADIVDEAGEIECPALLFTSNGKQTSNGWVEHQKNFASKMNAKLICFDCGHYIHYYKSKEICEEIKAFVSSLGR